MYFINKEKGADKCGDYWS